MDTEEEQGQARRFNGANKELLLKKRQEEWSFGLETTMPPYRYTQDEEPMTIIGFPGLTDPHGPTSLIKHLLGRHIGKCEISESYIIVKRASENKDIETHIQDTYEFLQEKDLRGSFLLVAESFGVYPAYGMTLRYPKLNHHIAGMISIHGPWEGVSGAAHIVKTYQRLQTLRLGWLVDSLLDYYQFASYKIPKALETLNPNGPFLREVKETLPEVKYPILALAGKATERIGPYKYLYKLCKESRLKRLYSLGASIVLGNVEDIFKEYEQQGNDGLVTTASALAANILGKPAHFKGVVADATHFHYELNEYPKLWKEVTDFVKALDREEVET
jgi:hypothetical protein